MGLAFLEIPGIKGSARQKHVLEKIVIQGVSAETYAVPNWITGKPDPEDLLKKAEGKKFKTRHKVMVLTKPIDKASPKLYEALTNADTFNNVFLYFWRMPPGGGVEQNYYTIRMNGVQVAGIRVIMPNNRMQINELMPEQEELLLTYTAVEYIFDTTPTATTLGGGSGSGGTDKLEKANSEKFNVEFEPPIEAKAHALAVNGGKWAAKAGASQLYKLFKSDTSSK
ncbi:MAG: type VI secretion system tube protein Hcp [Planctomycetes bacterium]|nr:type VI secretion system tube protein Hcp [Planctomycetota bacterium]